MAYSITTNIIPNGNTTSTVDITKYVLADAANPSSIEEGGTAVLKFTADGLYFELVKLKALAATVTGASFSWTFESTKSAILTLTNPTADVVITIKAKVGVIPNEVLRPFLIRQAFPVDTRLVLSKKEMRESLDTELPDIYFALCKDDGKFYIYHKDTDVISGDTGKFILIDDTVYSVDGGEVMPLENSEV